MVIGCRCIFDKDLTYYADSWFLPVSDGDGIELLDHLTAHLLEGEEIHMLCRNKGTAFLNPFLVDSFDTAGFLFIRAHTVYTAHENITKYGSIGSTHQHFQIQVEAGVAFDAGHVQGNNRNLWHTGLFQGTADKAYIVGSTAASACLGHDDSNLVDIIFAGQKGIHDLAYYHKGRIAGIVVYIFQSNIYRMAVVIGKYFKVIAAGLKGSGEHIKVDRRHLRTEDRIVLPHLFGKGYFINSGGVDLTLLMLLFPDTDRRDQGTDTDPCCSQVINFIDLQTGIDLAGTGKNIIYLICGNSIQSTAKGVKLDQIQIVHGLYIACCSIEP